MVDLPTRTSPRQARSAKSLDLILDTAERLFHERGVVETSTVDVAAAAGVSVGRLYYWFPDKDAVTNAVMQRAEQRMREFFDGVVLADERSSMPELIDRMIPTAAEFFRSHPGSLAVLMRGPVDPVDHGRSMCEYMESLAGRLVEARVPDLPADERDLVARTITRIVVGMMTEYVHADEAAGALVLAELRYVLAAYLHSRYPGRRAAVWRDDDHTIRPSRPALGFDHARPVYPALGAYEALGTPADHGSGG